MPMSLIIEPDSAISTEDLLGRYLVAHDDNVDALMEAAGRVSPACVSFSPGDGGISAFVAGESPEDMCALIAAGLAIHAVLMEHADPYYALAKSANSDAEEAS